MATKLFVPALMIFILFFFSSTIALGSENLANIRFFRAIDDRVTYAKTPERYTRLVINDRSGRREYYIEKQPEYIIPKSAMKSVTVREMEKYTATGEPYRESKRPAQDKRRSSPVFYEILFKIKPPEAKRFSLFTATNKQIAFETKIGGQSIGLQEFDWPFEPDASGELEFTVYFRDDVRNSKLQQLLSPFGELILK